MLKRHQLARHLQKVLGDRDELEFKLTIGRDSYFLCAGQEPQDPSYRWLRVHHDEEARELVPYSGVSYFEVAQEMALAPSFSRWKRVEFRQLPARSKQTLKKSLSTLLTKFDPLTDGGFSFLQQQAAEPGLESASSYFVSHRQDLFQNDNEAIEGLKRLTTRDQFEELLRLASLGEQERDEEELESLLSDFAAEGTHSGSAGFSLNQDKALDKLSNFQLGERVLFPIFLASGLYLLGAKAVDIRIDSDEIWVSYESCEITTSLLESLPSALLSAALRPDEVGMRRLGQALLQSARRLPSHLLWKSGSLELDLRQFPDLEQQGAEAEAELSGEFYSKLPLSLDVAKRFFSNLTGAGEEESAIREALAFLPIPWKLNGEETSAEFSISPGCVVLEFTASPEESLLATLPSLAFHQVKTELPFRLMLVVSSEPGPGLTVMVDGLLAECPQEWPESRIQAFLWLKNQATDLSGRKLVQTQALEETMTAVRNLKASVPEHLLECYRSEKKPDAQWISLILTLLKAGPEFWQPLEDEPILPLVGEKEKAAPREVGEGQVAFYTTEEYERGLRSGAKCVRLTRDILESFRKNFAGVHNATDALESTKDYYAKLEEFLKKAPEDTALLCSAPFLSKELHGFDGYLCFTEDSHSVVRVLSQRRVLPLDRSYWVPGFMELVVNCNELEMDNSWKDVYLECRSLEERLRAAVDATVIILLTNLRRESFEVELNRERMTAGLRFLRDRGFTTKPYQDVKFIREVVTEMDTSGPVPLPRRVENYYSLSERPNFL